MGSYRPGAATFPGRDRPPLLSGRSPTSSVGEGCWSLAGAREVPRVHSFAEEVPQPLDRSRHVPWSERRRGEGELLVMTGRAEGSARPPERNVQIGSGPGQAGSRLHGAPDGLGPPGPGDATEQEKAGAGTDDIVPRAAGAADEVAPVEERGELMPTLPEAGLDRPGAMERIRGGEGKTWERLRPPPDRQGIRERVHQHRSSVAGREIDPGDRPDGNRNPSHRRDLLRDRFGDAGVRLAIRGQRLEDQEDVDIGSRPRIAAGARPEEGRVRQPRGHLGEHPPDEVPYGAALGPGQRGAEAHGRVAAEPGRRGRRFSGGWKRRGRWGRPVGWGSPHR